MGAVVSWVWVNQGLVQTVAWWIAAAGILLVLVGLAGIGVDRARRASRQVDELIAVEPSVFDQGRAEVVTAPLVPSSDEQLMDLAYGLPRVVEASHAGV